MFSKSRQPVKVAAPVFIGNRPPTWQFVPALAVRAKKGVTPRDHYHKGHLYCGICTRYV